MSTNTSSPKSAQFSKSGDTLGSKRAFLPRNRGRLVCSLFNHCTWLSLNEDGWATYRVENWTSARDVKQGRRGERRPKMWANSGKATKDEVITKVITRVIAQEWQGVVRVTAEKGTSERCYKRSKSRARKWNLRMSPGETKRSEDKGETHVKTREKDQR